MELNPFQSVIVRLIFSLHNMHRADQVSDARGIFVKENGIIFYRLNFTEANVTFVYNVTLSNPQSKKGSSGMRNRYSVETDIQRKLMDILMETTTMDLIILLFFIKWISHLLQIMEKHIPRIRIARAYFPADYNRLRIDRFMVDVIQGQTNHHQSSGILDLLAENGNII